MLIHIGYHKTATTWLQQNVFFAEGSDAFHAYAVDAAKPRAFADHFIRSSDSAHLSAFDDNIDTISAAIKEVEQAVRGRPGTPVLSHERLSGNPHAGGFDAKKIAHILNANFPEANILIVIREQKSFTLSCYFQYLSIGGTQSLKAYMRDRYDGRQPSFSLANIDFLPLVENYRALWGAQRVTVLPYELFAASPRDFLKVLEGVAGNPLDVPEAVLQTRENAKQHRGASHALRWLNWLRFRSSVNNYSQYCTPRTKALADGLFHLLLRFYSAAREERLLGRFAAQVEQRIGDRYQTSNARLSDLCGMDLSRYGYC